MFENPDGQPSKICLSLQAEGTEHQVMEILRTFKVLKYV